MFPVAQVLETYEYFFGYVWHTKHDENFHNTLLLLKLERGADLGRSRLVQISR